MAHAITADVPFAAPHGVLGGCMYSLKKVKEGKEDFFSKETLLGCTKLQYLWVVRHTNVVKPKAGARTVDRSKNTATTAFTPGAVDGEVLGYEIATGKYLGGYRFAARNSGKPDGANTGNADDVLEKELKSNVVAAIVAGPKK